MSTNGLSVSIPALRGTRVQINLMGRDTNVVTLGYLGTYKAIHIDEAAENRELVQNLKSFIYEFSGFPDHNIFWAISQHKVINYR